MTWLLTGLALVLSHLGVALDQLVRRRRALPGLRRRRDVAALPADAGAARRHPRWVRAGDALGRLAGTPSGLRASWRRCCCSWASRPRSTSRSTCGSDAAPRRRPPRSTRRDPGHLGPRDTAVRGTKRRTPLLRQVMTTTADDLRPARRPLVARPRRPRGDRPALRPRRPRAGHGRLRHRHHRVRHDGPAAADRRGRRRLDPDRRPRHLGVRRRRGRRCAGAGLPRRPPAAPGAAAWR